jgi:broad specificity phosphatase PhoE
LKSKKIYLIRHGQTDYNFQNIVQGGGVDSDLNETGRRQAQLFHQIYQNVPFDKVYTSALKRSIQSVEGFIKDGHKHEIHPELNEIHWGIKEKIKITEDENDYYVSIVNAWKNGNTDLAIEGGESPNTVASRLQKFLDLILTRDDEKTILICMHGRAMRIFLCVLMKLDLCRMDEFPHKNLGLYIINYNGSEFVLEATNNLTHLDAV